MVEVGFRFFQNTVYSQVVTIIVHNKKFKQYIRSNVYILIWQFQLLIAEDLPVNYDNSDDGQDNEPSDNRCYTDYISRRWLSCPRYTIYIAIEKHS